jgi:N-acetylneuraminate synthase
VSKDIVKGEIITSDMIDIKSPGKGLQPIYQDQLIGKLATRDIKKNDFFYLSDLYGNTYKPKQFNFNLKWGIPVRFHDYQNLIQEISPDILEFHLSYKDMEVELEDYLKVHDNIDLVVHSPELFDNDHILDLCSEDKNYRSKSIQELQKVVNITRKLKKYFPRTKRPCIVTNMGGFDKNGFLDIKKRKKMYQLIKDSLSQIDTDGVEIIAQTMPPFPWHFGGQSYHNLFMNPNEIVEFCKENNLRICLDVSHSKLACNYFKWDFDNFIKVTAPYTAHIHIVDAKGIDDEGIQIGTGEIDFKRLMSLLEEFAPHSSFIPEIWQGHKNSGEGFWEALHKLENFN